MKFRSVEDFDDLLMEANPSDIIEPGSDLEKALINDIEHTDTSYRELVKKYGLNSRSPIYSLIKRLNLNTAHRSATAIKPGSELEKSLIYDIENTDIPFSQLAKKYGLSSSHPIDTLIKRLNLNAIPRAHIIRLSSESEKDLIYDLENTDIPYSELVKKYGLNSYDPIHTLIKRRNLNVIPRRSGRLSSTKPRSELKKAITNELINTVKTPEEISKEYNVPISTIYSYMAHSSVERPKHRYHIYLNTLTNVELDCVLNGKIQCDIQISPSVYIGYYSSAEAKSIIRYLRDTYSGKSERTNVLAFYLKIASGHLDLENLISELKSSALTHHTSTTELKSNYFITVSQDKIGTENFYDFDYTSLSSELLYFIDRSKNKTKNSPSIMEIQKLAAKLDPIMANNLDEKNDYIDKNLKYIAYNLYSKEGKVVDSYHYIDEVPYETSFNIASIADIEPLMSKYHKYLLYGFLDIDGEVVYIGISVDARKRGSYYSNEQRVLIKQAFDNQLIKKLVIFKSNLPGQNRLIKNDLLYKLEEYFAEILFKTYPSKYPKALNVDKPGKNSSSYSVGFNRRQFDNKILSDKLLDLTEYRATARRLLKKETVNEYPYKDYAIRYIRSKNGDISLEDKKILYKNLPGAYMYILWNLCSSESEYKQISQTSTHDINTKVKLDKWRNYRIKNNLPITEDLDDDIDKEYYV